ncbi:MAG TPA: RNA 3'-terminal phosphate cyclase [Vicinamibacteria bacterium]|nr:RNA 3'-terminal phosphate cyclase [Vicinamibacteria bacterium]
MTPRLIPIDGAQGEGGGQVLRTALSLSAATGQGFELTRIRARRTIPGLRPQHLAAVRAAAMACDAKVGGVFEGSPDLRFEPGGLAPGDFRFEIATAGAATLVLQTVVAPLATTGAASRVAITGGTHVPLSPSFDYLARHWGAAVDALGLRSEYTLERAGFYPPGGGEIHARVEPWARPGALRLEKRGALVKLRGVSGQARLRNDVAQRQRDAAQARLWEARRLEAEWEVVEVKAASPGSFLLLEAVFDKGRGAFGYLGERGVRAEIVGDRAARRLLRFLEEDGATDPCLADQLVVPLALSGGGGLVTTTEVTAHLETVAATAALFGVKARVLGRRGMSGAVEVERN